jgi:microtubule-associated protein 1
LKENFEPVWMDLAYVPHHGCKNYTNVEFFKRIRARYYVFSGVEPCKDVFNALLEAKKTWENKDQGKLFNFT